MAKQLHYVDGAIALSVELCWHGLLDDGIGFLLCIKSSPFCRLRVCFRL